MDSHQAILPDALRVNANLFQTDLWQTPDAREACKHYIHVIWIPAIHAGMTLLLNDLYNQVGLWATHLRRDKQA